MTPKSAMPSCSIMAKPSRLLYTDPAYIQGRIDSLQALVLGLAQSISKEEFRAQSLERLENLKTALLPSPVPEAWIQAVDECEKWVRAVTKP